MKNPDANKDNARIAEVTRMKEVMDAFHNDPPHRAISAMQVVVHYWAWVGPVEHFKREDEHFFRFSLDPDPYGSSVWEHVVNEAKEKTQSTLLNSYAVRDEFLRVKDWSGVYDFLSATGRFSRFSGAISWGQFQRWQDFARLVQAHEQLSLSIREQRVTSEQTEALKALSGQYPCSFFTLQDERAATLEPDQLELEIRRERRTRTRHGHYLTMAQNMREERSKELWQWFRQPPSKACSIEWLPKQAGHLSAVLPEIQAGTMIEYLLPREELRPALVIRPQSTLEAVAAAIFADFSNGVEYRTCDFCGQLFQVGRQKGKKFCNQKKCKNAAHSRKVRRDKRERDLGIVNKQVQDARNQHKGQ